MTNKRVPAVAGFGLIEVMLALLLIAVMAAGLIPLSQRYVSVGRDGRLREVALRLAESKLDELRHLAQQHQPQLINPGESRRLIMHTEFSLHWTVRSANWRSGAQAWQSAVVDDTFNGKQEVLVKVTWLGADEQEQVFSLQSAMVALPTLTAGPFGRRPTLLD